MLNSADCAIDTQKKKAKHSTHEWNWKRQIVRANEDREADRDECKKRFRNKKKEGSRKSKRKEPGGWRECFYESVPVVFR